MARIRNEKRARELDIRRDATKGAGRYVVEKGAQKGPDASVRAMKDANAASDADKKEKREKRKKDNDVNKGKGTAPNNQTHLSRGVKHLMVKLKDRPGGITKKAATIRAKRNISIDRTAGAGSRGGFDWAQDGLGVRDKNMGTGANNRLRRKKGVNNNITIRANVRGASAMGTGKVIHRRKKVVG